MRNLEFYRLLAEREMDLTKLSKQIFCGRSAVNQVLLGLRAGTPTWNKLAQVLTKKEYDVARKFAAQESFRIAGERLSALGWHSVERALSGEHWDCNGRHIYVEYGTKPEDKLSIDHEVVAPVKKELQMRGLALRALTSYGMVPRGDAVPV